jgi:hypothetical protein
MAPFVLATGADLSERLLGALKQIRERSVACAYNIPRPQKGAIDFGKVNVRTTTQAGAAEPAYVTSAGQCKPDKGGWYYDPAPSATATPSRLVLCPATCDGLRADPGARVDLVFGCTTIVN